MRNGKKSFVQRCIVSYLEKGRRRGRQANGLDCVRLPRSWESTEVSSQVQWEGIVGCEKGECILRKSHELLCEDICGERSEAALEATRWIRSYCRGLGERWLCLEWWWLQWTWSEMNKEVETATWRWIRNRRWRNKGNQRWPTLVLTFTGQERIRKEQAFFCFFSFAVWGRCGGTNSCVRPIQGFPGGASGKEPACQSRRRKRLRLYSWVRKIPWRRQWLPTPVFLPGKFHEQRSLASYNLWGCKELDMTENNLVCMHRPVKFGKSISMIMLNQQLDGKDF